MNAIWIAVAAVSLLGLAFGAILGYASRRFAVEDDPVVEKIDEILPQSQCGQCGYPGCRPYAEAISCNGEKINTTTGKQLITYYVNIWDEKSKTFKLKKVKQSKLVKMDYSQF